ncbi:hypothetical protein FALCPG4_003365 [Fusarium falciforme]
MDQANRRQKPSKAGEQVFKTKSCNIPSLTELRKSLGYGHRGEKQDIAFKKALTTQVETFVSKDNLPGVSFTQWKTPAHQKGLREMTKDFLAFKQKGPEFWPDDPNSSNKRPLEYTRDYEQIHRLLTKVFYRTVREHKRKQSTTPTTKESDRKLKTTSMKQSDPSKNSSEQSSRQAYRGSRGQSADDPIELDNMQSTTNASAPSADVDPFAGTSLMFTFRQFMPLEGMPDGIPPTDEPDEPTDRVWEIRDDYLDPQVPRDGNPTSSIPSQAAPEDPYQVPNSPAQETQVPRDRGKRPAHPYSIQDVRPAKAPRREQDDGEVVESSTSNAPPNNPSVSVPSASSSSANLASTSNSSSSFAPTSVSSQEDPPADRRLAAPVKKRTYIRQKYQKTRTSARHPKPVQRPDFAREETMERVIPNSPPSSSSSEEEDNVEEHRARDPAHRTATVSNDTSRQEDPSTTAPRHNATATAAEQPSSQARQMGSKKQASAKKGSMGPPRAPVPRPASSTRRGPVQESPAGPSTKRNSARRQANGSSTSNTGTRQPQTSHPQTSQPQMNEPQTEQNQPSPNNNMLSAEERQIIDASSVLFWRNGDEGFESWTPTVDVFQMTLSELMSDLGWIGANVQPLYMRLKAPRPYKPWVYGIEPGNNDKFNDVMHSFIDKMQSCYEQAKKPKLRFELQFNQEPVFI